MESYIVSARKYRPSTFKSVVGQHALVNTLKNAVKSGRLAHSYLFCGQRGVGKTTMARIFAKAINCEHLTADGEPCNECESCRAFNEQRSLNIIELDAASNNSVDDIRQLTDQVLVPPVTGRYRVFIVDEVHMLSAAAFNAFLKTLEEPPKYVIFILATTERQKILPTILSRCQKYDFQRITPSDIAEQLKYVADHEGYTTEPEALNVIAQKADGAMRDALSIFDQVAAASMGNITYRAAIDNLNVLDYDYYFRLVDAFADNNVEQSLLVYKDVRDHGFDSRVFINGVAAHLRELVVAHSPELVPLMEVTGEIAERYKQQAARCPLGKLYQAMDLCNTCDLNYINATNKRFIVELTLIKICQLFGGETAAPTAPQPLRKVAPAAPAAPAPQRQAAPAPVPQPVQATPQPQAPVAQPVRPVRPAPAPRPQATPGGKVAGLSSVSIKAPISGTAVPQSQQPAGSNAAETEKKNDIRPLNSPRSEAYTDDAFREGWREFVRQHEKEAMLYNAMIKGFPSATGEPFHYEFVVDNPAQKDKIESFMPDILQSLRNFVSNDSVMLSVKVRERQPGEKIWNQTELMKEAAERNPKVLEFIKKYQLSLA
ncbi:MAG: DNA polymerase III subunit gamma/tau [Porphyromonadaceae bacterium]|jgi:DNA polymerase-3 subunit gamma/tau|nr:DNA polymerase III subunit gamma/tau [Porphyromonadaceae bacterium]